ncbi:hypothetical protein CDAR_602411 [Caerostris darwini]|uniref:Uncharacterized protein n=1 Tax=Caerostris darwini TaxID=1538125 RepID=A0AAV4MGB7_9ARAC|nr:hypothetical protein CDAR_602411 [Caerostris darwini]
MILARGAKLADSSVVRSNTPVDFLLHLLGRIACMCSRKEFLLLLDVAASQRSLKQSMGPILIQVSHSRTIRVPSNFGCHASGFQLPSSQNFLE